MKRLQMSIMSLPSDGCVGEVACSSGGSVLLDSMYVNNVNFAFGFNSKIRLAASKESYTGQPVSLVYLKPTRQQYIGIYIIEREKFHLVNWV